MITRAMAIAATVAAILPVGTTAQAEYPEKSITLLSGFQAGGNVDLVARAQEGFVVAATRPYKTFRDVVEAAKKGTKITVGAQSPINNLMVNAINRKEGVKLALVPLKSGSEVVPMLLGDHITLGFTGGFHQPFVEQGKLRVIVSSHTARLAASPDVPSLNELGYLSVPASLQLLVAPCA